MPNQLRFWLKESLSSRLRLEYKNDGKDNFSFPSCFMSYMICLKDTKN